MGVFGGDYIGFSYNGVHSSELGIMRVSEGSRYNENLLPTSKDITVQVPGGDGTYYFGSYYTQRPITISYAFDELNEGQLQYMEALFGDKQVHPLIFDERPYKIYYAKVTGTTSIKHIPFTQAEKRIFKGEGSIQFICYQPFAVCKNKFLKEYSNFDTTEWGEASNLLFSNKGGIDEIDDDGNIKVYNPGVKETDWRMTFRSDDGNFPPAVFRLEDSSFEFEGATAKTFTKNGSTRRDSRVVFNSKTKMIEGFYEEEGKFYKSGNLYNEYLISGDFFDIPVTIELKIEGTKKSSKILSIEGDLKGRFVSLDYDYYYY